MAERVGFEPTHALTRLADFESAPLGLLGTSPFVSSKNYIITGLVPMQLFFQKILSLFVLPGIRCGTQYFLHIFLELCSRYKNAMLAAYAFDTDIHPHADNFHFIGSAGMLLLHLNDIAQLELFTLHSDRRPFHCDDTLPFADTECQFRGRPVLS